MPHATLGDLYRYTIATTAGKEAFIKDLTRLAKKYEYDNTGIIESCIAYVNLILSGYDRVERDIEQEPELTRKIACYFFTLAKENPNNVTLQVYRTLLENVVDHLGGLRTLRPC